MVELKSGWQVYDMARYVYSSRNDNMWDLEVKMFWSP
jgi:hypothetical protein